MVWYQHGGDIYSQQIEIDYSANTNPLGLPDGVKKAVIASLKDASRYPDSECRRLKSALANYHKVQSDSIICGNGAADLIFQLAFAIKPRKALIVGPSFLEYEQALKAVDCEIAFHILNEDSGFALNAKVWMEELDESLDLVFLCNPNNPTGLVIGGEDLERMIAKCRKLGITAVIDECFLDFVEDGERDSLIAKTEEYENIFVLKAFTKLYGMAGIRLGYGICKNRNLLEGMESVRQPWSVSVLAQAAGEAALLEHKYLEKTGELIPAEREYLKIGLISLGFRVFDSKANYIFFKDMRKCAGNSLYEQCRQRKVLIRSCDNYRGLTAGYYRICVKTRAENSEFLKVLEALI